MCWTDHAKSKTRRSLARRVCIHCFSSVPLSAPSLRICAGCHGPRYCSLDCAKAHWRGGHRDVCSRAHAPAVAAPEPSRLTAISTASSDVSDRQGRLRSADLGIREDHNGHRVRPERRRSADLRGHRAPLLQHLRHGWAAPTPRAGISLSTSPGCTSLRHRRRRRRLSVGRPALGELYAPDPAAPTSRRTTPRPRRTSKPCSRRASSTSYTHTRTSRIRP